MKRCRKCGEEKSLDEFQKRSVCRDGLDTWCAPCRRASDRFYYNSDINGAQCKRYREANRDYFKKYHAQYYKEHRDRIKAQAMDSYWKHRERIRERKRKAYLLVKDDPEYRARSSARMRKWLKNGGRTKPEHAARAAVYNAVRSGVMERKPCEKCGSPESQGHHWKGYAIENWFNVQWLCRRHHNEIHGRMTHS